MNIESMVSEIFEQMALKRNLTRFLNDIVTIKKESKEMDEGYYGSEYKKINTLCRE